MDLRFDTQTFHNLFTDMASKFGLVAESPTDEQLVYRNKVTVLTLFREQSDGCFYPSITDISTTTPKEYAFLVVMAIRNPEYRRNYKILDPVLSLEDNITADAKQLIEVLEKHCNDMLRGEFKRIEQEGYDNLTKYIQEQIPFVIRLPEEDPIRQKFWDGDLSWTTDLKGREKNR